MCLRLMDAPSLLRSPDFCRNPKAAQPPLGLDSIDAPLRRTATGSPHPCRRWGSRCVRCPFNRGGWAHHLPHQKCKIAKLKQVGRHRACIHHTTEKNNAAIEAASSAVNLRYDTILCCRCYDVGSTSGDRYLTRGPYRLLIVVLWRAVM